jgi:hypothetical protein
MVDTGMSHIGFRCVRKVPEPTGRSLDVTAVSPLSGRSESPDERDDDEAHQEPPGHDREAQLPVVAEPVAAPGSR